jgi:hypothetical protein
VTASCDRLCGWQVQVCTCFEMFIDVNKFDSDSYELRFRCTSIKGSRGFYL